MNRVDQSQLRFLGIPITYQNFGYEFLAVGKYLGLKRVNRFEMVYIDYCRFRKVWTGSESVKNVDYFKNSFIGLEMFTKF